VNTHTEEGDFCVSDVTCAADIVIDPSLSDDEKCGYECFYDVVNNICCVDDCGEFYYGDYDTNMCLEVECSQRKPNMQLSSNVCGESCFATDNFTCNVSCPTFYAPNKVSEFCELLLCSLHFALPPERKDATRDELWE
jgi:hypothetical protein